MRRPIKLLLPVLAFLTACPVVVMGADKPMVIQNPDGTFTVQKEPAKSDAGNAKAKKGLVIPPQVVVPIVLIPRKK